MALNQYTKDSTIIQNFAYFAKKLIYVDHDGKITQIDVSNATILFDLILEKNIIPCGKWMINMKREAKTSSNPPTQVWDMFCFCEVIWKIWCLNYRMNKRWKKQ